MPRLHQVGERRELLPIPPIMENTVVVNAGVLDIGVEYRHMNDAIVDGHAATDDAVAEYVAASRAETDYDDQGVSIHVFDAETHLEYLRFDAFGNDPHYHYLTPGSHHVDVAFDDIAQGDYLEWVYRALIEKAPQMLEFAGATHLVSKIDRKRVETAISEVRELARNSAQRRS